MGVSQLSQSNGAMSIGDLASLTGVTVEALRYYEQRGLVKPTGRRASGYREYSAETVRLVRFIKRAQSLGFTLTEVDELVRLREQAWLGNAPWRLREAAVAKIDDIDRRLSELSALKSELGEMVAACDTACPDDGTDSEMSLPCPLVDAFDTESTADLAGVRSTTTRGRKR